MARRNDHSKEEIRQMITATGFNIIEKEGFSKFSTRKIAKEIGYTVGTLYNVFDSYDDIILHINAITLDKIQSFLEKNLNPKLKGDSSVKQLAKLYIEYAHKNRNVWSALFEYNLPQEFILPEWYSKIIESLFGVVEGTLYDSISEKSELLKHAKVIWASIHGICVLSLTQKLNVVGEESVEVLTDSLISNYMSGIEK